MIGFFYTVLYSAGFVLLTPVFLYKMWKRGKYRENFWQRFGSYSVELRQRLAEKKEPRCWIQAVSVGEVNVALLFIGALQRKFPNVRIIMTTTTSTGYTLAYERVPPEVELLYFPQDFPWCVRRAYDLIQPDFIVLMESELWPNHIWMGVRRHVPLFLVNGRMSPRSERRYKRLNWLSRQVFNKLSLVCAQSPEDANNFAAVGVAPDRVHMAGNMKYDVSMPHADVQLVDPVQLLKQIDVSPAQPILVAGSTHSGEEEILLDIFADLRRKFPRLFLIIVPRHVERTREIVEVVKRKQVKFILRTDINAHVKHTAKPYDCLIVNTTGELKWFYKVATVIFVGKSLVGQGGQNIVEAAVSGHPVLFGPHMQNFRAIAREFVAEGACVQIQDIERNAADKSVWTWFIRFLSRSYREKERRMAMTNSLRQTVQELLEDPKRRHAIATAAHRVIQSNIGATNRCVDLIARALSAKKTGN